MWNTVVKKLWLKMKRTKNYLISHLQNRKRPKTALQK